jgi:hypothetical protein
MKKISFDVVFKIIVLLLLSIILIICSNKSESISESSTYQHQAPAEVGRYKEIKVKTNGRFGGVDEEVLILDTKTGKTTYPN